MVTTTKTNKTGHQQVSLNKNEKSLKKLDTMTPDLVKARRLRHPTFQRIFGRAKEARGAGPTLGPPLYAITRSNWSPGSARNWIAVHAIKNPTSTKN